MTMQYSAIRRTAILLALSTTVLSLTALAQDQPATAEEAAKRGWVPAAANTSGTRQGQAATPNNTPPSSEAGFPAAPGSRQVAAGTAGQAAPASGGQQQEGRGQQNGVNGVTNLAPLPPPSQLEDAKQIVSPLTPNQITDLRGYYEDTRRASIARPVNGEGQIRSTSVELDPGSPVPELRTMPNELSTMVFVDSTGAPWPLRAAPRVSRNDLFDVNWLEGTNIITVSPLTSYNQGTVTLILDGMSIPVSVKMSTINPESNASKHYYDTRHDFRIPGRGPNAQTPTTGTDQIALYDQVMQNFLDGIPPNGAQPIDIAPDDIDASAWTYDNSLYLRTTLPIRSSFQRTLSSADGTHVYKMSVTPFLALSSDGRTINIKLDI